MSRRRRRGVVIAEGHRAKVGPRTWTTLGPLGQPSTATLTQPHAYIYTHSHRHTGPPPITTDGLFRPQGHKETVSVGPVNARARTHARIHTDGQTDTHTRTHTHTHTHTHKRTHIYTRTHAPLICKIPPDKCLARVSDPLFKERLKYISRLSRFIFMCFGPLCLKCVWSSADLWLLRCGPSHSSLPRSGYAARATQAAAVAISQVSLTGTATLLALRTLSHARTHAHMQTHARTHTRTHLKNKHTHKDTHMYVQKADMCT